MKYKSKPCVIDAVQWNKPGDHPEIYQCFDGYCGHEYRLNEQLIHTGDYILTHSDGRLEVMSEAEFLSKYEKEVFWKECAACSGWGYGKCGHNRCPDCNGTGKVEE